MGRNNPSAYSTKSRQEILSSIIDLEMFGRVPKRFYGLPNSKFKVVPSLSRKEKEINKAYKLRDASILKYEVESFIQLEREISENPFNKIQDSYLLPVFTSKRFTRKLGEFGFDEKFAFEDIERLRKVKKLEDLASAYGEDRHLFTQFAESGVNSDSKDALDLKPEFLDYLGVHPNSFEKLYKRSA
ncbi:MAG: hypothetical protein PF569_06130 [Candidatus Woesearchaeota archaeon]|jgi:hypothetical protein|nr:hypothetical protein [Candidatus Woesearchaeota archaeon]